MFRSSMSTFDKLLEKATSNLRLEPDWPAILQICDLIRQGDCPPKYALAGIKKKMNNQNPYIAMYALLILESLVKNCGHIVHDEVCTKAYMEQLKDYIRITTHTEVKAKLLEMIQAWANAFRSSPKYRAVQDILNIMKTDGYKFPALKESDAMFSADSAPEWVDDAVCHRCRAAFGVVNRKHHCRACGKIFCNSCSSKQSTIPKFGIEKEVRVCDNCYDQLNAPRSSSPHAKPETETLPAEYLSSSLSQQNQTPKPKGKSNDELKEEEELQLALALSQSEAEAKEKEKKKLTASYAQPRPKSPPSVMKEEEPEDPELARYLNRSYWEQKQTSDDSRHSKKENNVRVSPAGPPSAPSTPTHKLSNGDLYNPEIDEFVTFLKGQVEVFVNRMKSNASRGRTIATDSSIQTLFMNVAANHSQLLKYIHQQDDMRVHYEGLQDKLAQVKDARAALDALREEHRDRLRREAEEAERQKQLQMAHKLQIMRKKKQEYLQYQRQLALQKVQEQEREMQMRQEQQKQQYMMHHGSYIQQWSDPSMYQPYGTAPGPVPHAYIPGYAPPHQVQTGLPGIPQPNNQPPGMPPQMMPGGGPTQQQPPQSQQQQGPPNFPGPAGSGMVLPGQNPQRMSMMQSGQLPPAGYPGMPMGGPPPQLGPGQPPQGPMPGQQPPGSMPGQPQGPMPVQPPPGPMPGQQRGPGPMPHYHQQPPPPHGQPGGTAELISFD